MPTTYAIPDGRTVMAATTYTGTSASNAVVNTVNGTSFQPDFVWIKNRSGAISHSLYDAVRGAGYRLSSNETTAQLNYTAQMTGFNSNGFSVATNNNEVNESGTSYVAWQWNAGGSTVTNTDGTISAQVRANPTAGFSVVTYTGTGANATVGHGLGVAPKFIIIKGRNTAYNWAAWHGSFTGLQRIFPNTTGAVASSASYWNSATPTSTTFSLGSEATANDNLATFVAYCFAAVAGYSAFGSYTGNGSTDGPFVYLGFRPRFVLIKMSTGVAFWRIHDTSRNPYNVADLSLYPNANYADTTAVSEYWDILSNGFKLRTSDSEQNLNGATYIYAAFAENPFKYANAR